MCCRYLYVARPGSCRCPCCPPVSPDTPSLSGWLYCTYMWLGQVALDVVVALHACGALSDVALGHAACQGAGFVVCPCCFLSNSKLRVSVPSDGKDSSDLVTVEEWLKLDPTQYGQLKQLAEVQGDINIASEAMHTLCGLRSMAVDRLWQGSKTPEAELDVTIKKFPIGFSTRNFCIVGKFDNK